MKKVQREIKWNKLTRKEWLETVPYMIYKLKRNYDFYMSFSFGSDGYNVTQILPYVEKSKNFHKMILCHDYRHRYYFIVFAKNFIKIYYSNEYTPKDLRYFKGKCLKFYTRAEEELKNQEEREIIESYNE